MRFEKGTHLLRRFQLAVNELKEYLVHDVCIDGQLRGDAHLLQQGMGDALTGLWPYLEELVKAFLYRQVLGCKPKPKNSFRIIAREKLIPRRWRCVLFREQDLREFRRQRVQAV